MEGALTLRTISPPLLQLARSLPLSSHRNLFHVRSRDMHTCEHRQPTYKKRPSAHVEAGQRSRVWTSCHPTCWLFLQVGLLSERRSQPYAFSR